MSWEQFWQLAPEEMAFHVAVFRTNRQIEAVLAYQQYRKNRAAGRGRRPPKGHRGRAPRKRR